MVVQRLYATEESQQLRDAARGFLARYCPPEKALALAEDPAALRELWQRAAAQGWTSLGAQSEAGGLPELLIVLEEAGRAACPLPLLDAFLVTTALERTAAGTQTVLQELAEGTAAISLALGPADGDRLAGQISATAGPDGRLAFSGTVRFVEGCALATHLLVAVGTSDQVALIKVDAPGVRVTLTSGFAVPSLSDISLKHVAGTLITLPKHTLTHLALLARLGCVARAYGAAQRAFDMAVEHAKVRTQFDTLIGRFQAIQHKLANSFIGLNASRLLLDRAGASYDPRHPDAPQWQLQAFAACAFANPFLRQCVLESMHAFGGISYMEEHEVPRHFRRVHADLFRFGGVQAARMALANVLLSGQATLADLDLGPAANAFRQEVRAWLAEHWSAEKQAAHRQLPVKDQGFDREFSRALGEKGWLGLGWSARWGGQERSAFEQLVFEEEMAAQGAPMAAHTCGTGIVGPALMAFGNPEQQQRFLPAFLRGEETFCLGYSEPEAGSDLASLRLSAVRDETGWVLNGTKIFTTLGDKATYVWLAARTETKGDKHAGISVFLVPTNTPGITIHPDMALYGHTACTVFYDNVHVPEEALVGRVNEGWKVITSALARERILMGGNVSAIRTSFDRLLAYVTQADETSQCLGNHPQVQERIGTLAADLEAARMLLMQSIDCVAQGKPAFHEAAMTKVFTSELEERLPEVALEILGSAASFAPGAPNALLDGIFENGLRSSIFKVIGGGSNEIQRTLIATRGLGLPR